MSDISSNDCIRRNECNPNRKFLHVDEKLLGNQAKLSTTKKVAYSFISFALFQHFLNLFIEAKRK